jgi:Flp pilus assembly protein TadG
VEFALVLPLLIVLVLGMLDFGRAINYWNDETHLANEAARYAAVNNSPNEGWKTDPINPNFKINAAIKDQAVRSTASVTFCFPGITIHPGDNTAVPAGAPVKARVSDTYHWFQLHLKGLAGIGDKDLSIADTVLTGTSTMRLEQAFRNDGKDAYIAQATC